MAHNMLDEDAQTQEPLDLRTVAMRIDNDIHDEDVDSLKFLCQGLLAGNKLKRAGTALELISLLESAGHVSNNDYFLLADLLQYIHRIDVLELIEFDEQEVLTERQRRKSKIDAFYVLLFQIAEDMPDEDVKKAAFMYGKIPRSQKLSSGLDVFTVMVQHKAIAPGNIIHLRKILESLERNDLVEIVDKYSSSQGQSAMLEQNFIRSREDQEYEHQLGQGDIEVKDDDIDVSAYRQVHGISSTSSPTDDVNNVKLSSKSELNISQSKNMDKTSIGQRQIPTPLELQRISDKQQLPQNEAYLAALQTEVLPMAIQEILIKNIEAKCWIDIHNNLGLPAFPTASGASYSERPQTGKIVLNHWLNHSDTKKMDFRSARIHFLRALDSAGRTLIGKDLAKNLGLNYDKDICLKTPTQASNETSSQGSAAHISEVMLFQQGAPAPVLENQIRQLNIIPSETPIIPRYKMDAVPRGICFIINNKDFYQEPNVPGAKLMPKRDGTDVDRDKLKQTFEKLGFIIIPKDNLTDKDMIREMKMMSLKDHSAYDCFVCCILTHGVLGSLYGINGITTPIRDLTGPMRAQSCPTLAGKPKLFFMQACQGREKQTGHPTSDIQRDSEVEIDGPGEVIPNEADFLLGYATVPGYVSYRSKTRGSWYITKLTELLAEYAFHYDILDILTKVNYEVGRGDANMEDGTYKQSPAPMYSLRKKLIFGCP